MLRSLARLAVELGVDTVANRFIESFYCGRPAGRLSSRFQVLVYHKVSPDRHPYYEPVDPDAFEQQMRFLSRCYKVMDLLELVERSRKSSVPAGAVAITFDDGYRDNYDYAFPILQKYGLTATIFVATGVTGSSNLLWHDRVFDAFRYTNQERASLRNWNLPELVLDSPERRQQSLSSALGLAKTLWGDARSRFVEAIEDQLRPQLPGRPPRMLNWDQIGEMRRAGIAFGSHTVTHPILSCLPRHELIREIGDSKRHLEEQLGEPIRAFAYPNGKVADFGDEAKAVLQECGYRCAVTTIMGFNRNLEDPFELKRYLPWESEIELFRFKFFLQRHGLYN